MLPAARGHAKVSYDKVCHMAGNSRLLISRCTQEFVWEIWHANPRAALKRPSREESAGRQRGDEGIKWKADWVSWDIFLFYFEYSM